MSVPRHACQILLAVACSIFAPCVDLQAQDPAESFKAGDFAKAADQWRLSLGQNDKDMDAVLGLAKIALYQNDFAEVSRRLAQLESLDAEHERLARMFAEMHYRQDQFADAAGRFRQAGRKAMADKLESFGDAAPYEIEGTQDEFRISFVQTDPLPVISASVNGGEEALFLLDTGGGELILDPEFAERMGARTFGKEESVYAGDQKGTYEHAAIDSFTMGELTVNDMPVHLLSTTRFSAVTGGRPVAGVLGTNFLYHFLTTIDYPSGELILRRRGSGAAKSWRDGLVANSDSVDSSDGESHVVPMWMASDHLILARGAVSGGAGEGDAVKGGAEALFLVDTGLAGAAFTCPESTLKAAGIEVSGDSQSGVGGGGTVSIRPFQVPELSLGPVKQKGLLGIAGAFPKSLEHGQGFRIGGLISHAFFRPYSVTLDFERMQLVLESPAK